MLHALFTHLLAGAQTAADTAHDRPGTVLAVAGLTWAAAYVTDLRSLLPGRNQAEQEQRLAADPFQPRLVAIHREDY